MIKLKKLIKNHMLWLTVTAICCIAYLVGILNPLDNFLKDLRFGSYQRSASAEVVVVEIDAQSIQALGSWPIARQNYAIGLDHLFEAGASQIAMDIDFSSISDDVNDTAFEAALKRHNSKVILPSYKQRSSRLGADTALTEALPIERFKQHVWLGSVNVSASSDGLIRNYAYGEVVGGLFRPSLAVLLSGVQSSNNNDFIIDYSIKATSIPSISFKSVLDGSFDRRMVTGKKIIIGTTAIEAGDEFAVPSQGVIPGVIIQAIATESLLQDRTIQPTSDLFIILLIIISAIIVERSGRRSAWTTVTVLGLVIITSLVAGSGLIQKSVPQSVDVAAPILAVIMCLSVRLLGTVERLAQALFSERIATTYRQNLMQRVVDASFDGTLLADEDMQVIDCNQSAERILKHSREHLLAGKVSDVIPWRMVDGDRPPQGVPFEIQMDGSQQDSTIIEVIFSKMLHSERISRRSKATSEKTINIISFRDVTERKQSEDRIEYLSTHDALTGLPNRKNFIRTLSNQIAAATREEREFELIGFNIDEFQKINDRYGAGFADETLKMTAFRLKGAIQDDDIIARVGADEFIIFHLLSEIGEDTNSYVKRLHQEVSRSIPFPEFLIKVSISVGVSRHPAHGKTSEDLLKNATTAIVCAKRDGGARLYYFDPSMDEAQRSKELMEQKLRLALEENWFELHFQPLVLSKDRSLIGFEALIRLRHPDDGMIRPDLFIPVAEETGLIIDIGDWVLEEACRQAASWPRRVRVSVNLSTMQFKGAGLVDKVTKAIEESGLPPKYLDLEITESMLIDDQDIVLTQLEAIQSLGVSVSMDDFGTGYSSLGYLQTIPFQKIKLDRSFIQDVTENHRSIAIISAVVGMGHSLSASIVAEGIETEQQASLVAELECDELQGYLISKPCPADELEQFFALSD